MRSNPIRWLYDELPGLVEHGVLTPDAADSLRGHYGPLPERGGRRALFVGSGIVLLLAHNWEDLSRPVRAGLSVGLLMAAQGVALWAGWRRNDSPAVLESAAVFLGLSLVACFALIQQTYNIGGDLKELLFRCVLLTLPVAYLLRSRIALALVWIGATWWLMLGYWPQTTLATYPFGVRRARSSPTATDRSCGRARCSGSTAARCSWTCPSIATA
jgi:hypothetical protein